MVPATCRALATTFAVAALLPLAACRRVASPPALLRASSAGQPRNGTQLAGGNASAPPAVALASANHSAGSSGAAPPTFQHFYNQHAEGRGLNKWNNALEAYQRHLAPFAGEYVALGEIGVQSGGSIDMWHAILGPGCKVYGIDINPQTKKFEDAMTTIVIGDQADVTMWQRFFASTVKGPIHVLIDDGGHEANQMLTTLMQSFDHLTPNGLIAIEDIHGPGYLGPFFLPAAHFLGYKAAKGELSSVDMYPFLLIAQREYAAPLSFTGTYGTVNSIDAVWTEAAKHPGGYVILENPGWGSFLTPSALTNFFTAFAPLHGSNWYSTPAGCDTTSASVCSVTVIPDRAQALIKGIHIYANRLVAEVQGGPVTIQAVRRGTNWIAYG